MTAEEKLTYLGRKNPHSVKSFKNSKGFAVTGKSLEQLPTSVDWRSAGSTISINCFDLKYICIYIRNHKHRERSGTMWIVLVTSRLCLSQA